MRLYYLLIILNTLYSVYTFKFSTTERWYDSLVVELKNILRNGYSPLGIPKADPFLVNSFFNWTTPGSSMYLNLNGLLSNFSDFYVNNIDIKPDLTSSVELAFTAVNFKGTYDVNGQIIKIIPLNGRGTFELFVGNVVLLTNYTAFGSNRTVQLKNFKFIYNIGVSNVVLTGFLEQYKLNNIVSEFLHDVAPAVLTLLKSQLESLINQTISGSGNKWLRDCDPRHVIEAVKWILIPKNKKKIKIAFS